MTPAMNCQISTKCRSDNHRMINRRWPLSYKDYKVIQIKDEDQRITIILRATPSQPPNRSVLRLPTAGFVNPSPGKIPGCGAQKGPPNSATKPVVTDRQSVLAKRKRPALNAESCSQPKKPRLTTPGSPTPSGGQPAPPNPEPWFARVGLRAQDVEVLDQGEWLTDDHISAAQRLLGRQFPSLGGLQDPVLAEIQQLAPMAPGGVQILLNGGGHWVTAVRQADGSAQLLDSKNGGVTARLRPQLVTLCGAGDWTPPPAGDVRVHLPVMHPQRGSSDCGAFAVAYATEVAHGGRPELAVFDQSQMRRHFRECLQAQRMTPFPRKNCSQRTPNNVGNKSETLSR